MEKLDGVNLSDTGKTTGSLLTTQTLFKKWSWRELIKSYFSLVCYIRVFSIIASQKHLCCN